jgi:ABC-type methionine transport system ATPase subunit
MIEHDVRLVMGICSEITVLEEGRVIANGIPELIRKNPTLSKKFIKICKPDLLLRRYMYMHPGGPHELSRRSDTNQRTVGKKSRSF